MHMLVVVLMFGAAQAAECKAGGARVVQYFVQQAAGLKGAQYSVKGNSIERGGEHFFQICLGKGRIVLAKEVKHLSSLAGIP